MEEARSREDDGRFGLGIPGARDLVGALALLTSLPLPAPDIRGPSFGRVALLFPPVGLLLGAVLAALDYLALGGLPPAGGALLLVVVWEAMVRRRSDLASGAAAAIAAVLLVAKWVALWSLPVPRTLALFFAPLLGRWSMVVLAVGARDAGESQRKLAPALMFNEFALASVFTFGTVFAAANGVGLAIAVQAAAATLALRVYAHGKAGGVSWRYVRLCAALVEATTLSLLAVLAIRA